MKTKVIRTRANNGQTEWCALEVEIRKNSDEQDVLSVCGSSGFVATRASARREALQYWESFFDDQPEEIKSMNERFGKHFRSSTSAARFVLQTDDEYHGLDVYKEEGNKIYILYSCGQIREELGEFFPEHVPMFKWHLNDMRPSPERTKEVVNCWGAQSTIVVPEGAEWVYEPLPESVYAWVRGLKQLENA